LILKPASDRPFRARPARGGDRQRRGEDDQGEQLQTRGLIGINGELVWKG